MPVSLSPFTRQRTADGDVMTSQSYSAKLDVVSKTPGVGCIRMSESETGMPPASRTSLHASACSASLQVMTDDLGQSGSGVAESLGVVVDEVEESHLWVAGIGGGGGPAHDETASDRSTGVVLVPASFDLERHRSDIDTVPGRGVVVVVDGLPLIVGDVGDQVTDGGVLTYRDREAHIMRQAGIEEISYVEPGIGS